MGEAEREKVERRRRRGFEPNRSSGHQKNAAAENPRQCACTCYCPDEPPSQRRPSVCKPSTHSDFIKKSPRH